MYIPQQEFLENMAAPLGWFYLAACGMNLCAAARAARRRQRSWAAVWLAASGLFVLLGWVAFGGRAVGLPEGFKNAVDAAFTPVSVTLGMFVLLVAAYWVRAWLVRPAVAWSIFNAMLLLFGLSLVDPDFAAVAAKPDNVAIVGMVFLLSFFLWLATAQAVENDRRIAGGGSPEESDYATKVLVWPDLVYVELIATILVTAGLLAWSLLLRAPLESPANPVVTPNPAKAPWYFLGLQELLVYSDAWWVGVVVPCLILLGLAAIPYLDRNPRGNGYYTIAERPFAFGVFQFGFLQLWILMILVGVFLRGPDWSFYGPYEARLHAAAGPLANVKLSEWFWTTVCRSGPPLPEAGAGWLVTTGTLLVREIVGLVLLGLYFIALPMVLARSLMKSYRRELGRWRYWLMALLLLAMVSLPLKMLLRWTFQLSYVVSFPEWSLNF